ncbi:copia protein [Tanacetum coccineum]
MHDEFEMSMMGELNFFLGLQIKQMEDGIFFNQSKYIKEMLKKFGLEDSKPMKTPMSSDTKLTKDEKCESVDSTKYRGMIDHLSVSVPCRGLYKTKPPYLRVIKTLIQVPRQGQETRTKDKKTIVVGGHKDHVSACLCHMLYCIETSIPYNLVFFILKRMEKTRFNPKELIPYGMLLTRLFKHVMSVSPKLAFDHYLSHDRAIHPLAPHYERNTRADRGMKRPRELNASSSSTTQNHPSSSRPLGHMVDENDDETFHSNSSSPSQQVSSSSNFASRVRQNPSHESYDLNTFLSETITLQNQQRNAHRDWLRSIGQALKNMIGEKRK